MRWLALAVLFLAACPDDDGGVPGEYVAVDEFSAAYKDAECTYLVRCGLFPDQATCTSAHLFTSNSIDADTLAAIKKGRIIYNGNNVKACFDAIANDTCDKTDEAGRVQPFACRNFTRGTLAEGATCLLGAECISGTCAVQSSELTCQMGMCVGNTPPDTEPPQNGEACTSLVGCAAGSFCDPMTDTCTTLRSAGDQCLTNADCAYGLGCAGSPRTCKVLPGNGEACPDGVCRDDGLYCKTSSAQPVCVPVGAVGAACDGNVDCSPYFPCDHSGSSGVCAKPPSLGERCSMPNGNCFDEASYCNPGTLICVAARDDGAACTTSLQCKSENCDPATNTCMTFSCSR